MVTAVSLKEYKADVLALVSGAVPAAEVWDGFSDEQRFGPLEKPLLALMVKKLTLGDGAMQGYYGAGAGSSAGSEWYGRQCDVVFGITCCLPKPGAEQAADEVFLSVCQALLFHPAYEFGEITRGELSFDRSVQGFLFEVQVKSKVIITEEDAAVTLSDIRVIPTL